MTPPSGAEFFVFDTPQAVSGGYGLEVYTEAGQLAFSSLHKYMRVVGSPTQPAGRRYAVVEASPEVSWYEDADRSEEHTSELQSLMRIPYDVLSLKKNRTKP